LILRTVAVLVLAAVLEVGGDALIRIGLHSYGYPLAAGALALLAYGVLVNQAGVDFNRLMGIYIAIFFVVSQAISLILFRQIPDDRLILGGGFIVAGGLVILLMT
jgi:drug/metabolite transporter superfamily protein YnfA